MGARFFGSNPNYTSLELSHLFSTTETKWVIAEQEHLDNVRNAWMKLDRSMGNVLVFDEFNVLQESEFRSWEILLEHGEDDWITFDNESISKNTIACLMSTSGTTGLPKAAQFSHYAQVAGAMLAQEPEKPYEVSSSPFARRYPLIVLQVSRLLCLPQFHAFNAPLSIMLPLREGKIMCIMRKYDTDHFLNALTLYKPTETTMVNPIVYKLLQLQDRAGPALSSLRRITTGGVRLPPDTRDKLQQLLHPDTTLRQVFGMTEIGWAISLLYPECDDTGAAGRLLPGVEAR
jgi:4-coumarate--CoA ligase